MRIVHRDGTDVVLPKKHDIAGGTYAIGGTASAWLYVTYNYAPIFFRVIGEGGIRSLHGMELREATPILDRAIAALGDAEPDADYWKATDGNARKALVGLRRLSGLALDAFPNDEMRWDCE
ncbi:MAG: hypothetical protein IKP01_07105 [Bacteroidales bacterium]|nr:hypothetical protein [Bacteroidales bacterium]